MVLPPNLQLAPPHDATSHTPAQKLTLLNRPVPPASTERMADFVILGVPLTWAVATAPALFVGGATLFGTWVVTGSDLAAWTLGLTPGPRDRLAAIASK